MPLTGKEISSQHSEILDLRKHAFGLKLAAYLNAVCAHLSTDLF